MTNRHKRIVPKIATEAEEAEEADWQTYINDTDTTEIRSAYVLTCLSTPASVCRSGVIEAGCKTVIGSRSQDPECLNV